MNMLHVEKPIKNSNTKTYTQRENDSVLATITCGRVNHSKIEGGGGGGIFNSLLVTNHQVICLINQTIVCIAIVL